MKTQGLGFGPSQLGPSFGPVQLVHKRLPLLGSSSGPNMRPLLLDYAPVPQSGPQGGVQPHKSAVINEKAKNKIKFVGPLRKSQRLENKHNGPYESVVERACRLKGGVSPGSKKRERRTKPNNKPTPAYLETSDPLTPCQAEIVINMAGIGMSEEMENNFKNLVAGEETGLTDGTALLN